MKRQLAFVFLALAVGLGPVPGEAQVRPPGGQRQRQQLERRLEQGLARIVSEDLGLTPEEMASVQAVMQGFREERQAVSRAQASLRYRLRDPALPDLEDDAAREILAEMIRVQEAELDLYRREQTQLLTVLTPGQVVRFYGIREAWGQRIQELRQPGGRGPGGPPGMGLDPTGGLGGVGRRF
jgi:Spy/CpxP family protein refolding chaperone